MNYIFQSCYQNAMNGYSEFRKALGFSAEASLTYLRRFDRYCAGNEITSDSLTKEIVDAWLKDEQEKGYIDMCGRARIMRTFAKYLRGTGVSAYILPPYLYRDKRTFVPYVMSTNELAAFFDAADRLESWHCGDRFVSYVAPVIFRLLFTSGLRPQEACNLVDSDVNLDNAEILIRVNKRRKDRIVIVSDDMLRLLNEYVAHRTNIFVRTPYFFPRIDGRMYTAQQLGAVCDRCWEMANPDLDPSLLPPLRPYDFRHTFASTVLQKWINEGIDLFTMLPYLRTYMGHEHFEDTAYYIHILPERLSASPGVNWDAIDAAAPEVSIWD